MVNLSSYVQLFHLNNPILRAVAILLGFFILSKLLVFVSQKYLLRITKKTKTKAHNRLIQRTNGKISLILLLIGINLAWLPLKLTESVTNILHNILYSFVITIITFIAIDVLDILIQEWDKAFVSKTNSKTDGQIVRLFHRFSSVFFFGLALVFILQTWGVEISALLASFGIAGLAVAFALQTTLGNVFGGIALILDRSIMVGDRIELDSGESGIVEDVGLRSTIIKTWGNKRIVIPNGKLAESNIINHIKKEPRTRVTVPFVVAYGSNIENVREVIIPELAKIKNCLEDPAPAVQFLAMSDFSLDFVAKFWVDHVNNAYAAKLDAVENVYNALNKAKINIPFPTRTIYIKKE